MNDTPRDRLLRRARMITVGIVATAAAGTAALTAVAFHATAQGDTGVGTSGVDGSSGDTGSSFSHDGGTGVVPAPSNSEPQAGTNAS